MRCQWCGHPEGYKLKGRARAGVYRCKQCLRQYSETSARGHPWRATKLDRGTREAIEVAWRAGRNAHETAISVRVQPKTVYQAFKRLDRWYKESRLPTLADSLCLTAAFVGASFGCLLLSASPPLAPRHCEDSRPANAPLPHEKAPLDGGASLTTVGAVCVLSRTATPSAHLAGIGDVALVESYRRASNGASGKAMTQFEIPGDSGEHVQ